MRKYLAKIKKMKVCEVCGNEYAPKTDELFCSSECGKRIEFFKHGSLCDCESNCPAPPYDRLLHFGGNCYHTDGTNHRIYRKTENPKTEVYRN